MIPKSKTAAFAFLAAGLAATASHAAFTWENCKDIAATDFNVVPIATRETDQAAEPMKMAFDLLAAPGEDAKGKVDVYFTERLGKVRKFDSKTGRVITLATFTLNINQSVSSDGVLGIALDPAFKSNHQVYIYYTFISTAEKNWRVSRFTLNAAHDQLNLASEAVVIKIPIHGGSKHPGGALQFDNFGDLWITTGNDYYNGDFPVWSSANTNDLRGKILRIHPLATAGADGKLYSIPEGNLYKAGTASTKPEIYIMGTRNPYTLTLDPARRWALWGDVGPDNTNMDGQPMNGSGSVEKTEEYDLAQEAGNYGYPFFSGDTRMKAGIDPAGPVIPDNTNWDGNTPGLKTLPPAVAPLYPYKKSCAITGPLYRYDGDLVSSIKWPPHFQRKWFVSDFNGDNNKIKALTLDDAGKKVTGEEFIPGISLHSPLDIQSGPDGALYVNNYGGVWRASEKNTGLIRIEYKGDCRPALPKLEGATSIADQGARPGSPSRQAPRVDISQVDGLSVSVATAGRFTVEVRDLAGRPLASRSSQGPAPVAFAEVREAGVYFLRVGTAEGSQVLKVVRN
ncbi:MAG TPA: PQQ-dependent sugar dehydrogenase [Fibrobacteria bacterium]|nr:PQQ-dependent sugar dehydrogenase [Fibrobacteria bacterium]